MGLAGGECKLCGKQRRLSLSHVIPHGLLRITKGANSQLIAFEVSSGGKPRFDNVNWVERLLCSECEGLLNSRYERSQIARLKSQKDRIDSENRITLVGYDFDKFYLFWLSIFWRASISELGMFNSVELPEDLIEICRKEILGGKVTNPLLPDMLQIGILRVCLPPELGNDREIMSSFQVHQNERSIKFSLLIAGFAVVYSLSPYAIESLPEGFTKIEQKFNLRIRKVAPAQSKWLSDLFTQMTVAAQRNRGWR